MADRPSGEYQLFNLRLPVHTMARIQRYRDHLNATQPGIEANVSMAARMLLMRALDDVERTMAPSSSQAAERGAMPRRKG